MLKPILKLWLLGVLCLMCLTAEALPQLEMAQSGFVYDALAPMRYDELKQNWFYQHPNRIPTPKELEGLAYQAAYASSAISPVWKPITHWRLVGGSHPWMLVPRVQVVNREANQIALNLSLEVHISAEYGIWYPEAKGAITNVKQLQQNIRTQPLESYQMTLEALAVRDALLKPLRPIAVMPLLKSYPDRFPNKLFVKIKLLKENSVLDTETLTLSLFPDVFALPLYLY
jgi:hypothetical protein